MFVCYTVSMNSNIDEIINCILTVRSSEKLLTLFNELFTESELADLTKRWRILKMLSEKKTQREIAKELNVSLCKVTRGAKILKNKNSIAAKMLKNDKKHF